MKYRDLLDEDQRLALLEILEQDPDYSHNGRILKQALEYLRGHAISTDLVRTHLNWLEEQGLVTVQRIEENDSWIAKLTRRGEDVAMGRARVEGVARPRLH